MTDAILLVYTILTSFISFLFSDMEIVSGVTVGWVAIACLIFSVLFGSVLNRPSGAIRSNDRRLNTKDRERDKS